MIRNLFCIGLMLSCMGFPLQAKGIVSTSTTTPLKKGPSTTSPTKAAVVAKAPAPAVAKSSSTKSSSVTASSAVQTKHGGVVSLSNNPSASTASNGRLARLTAYWAGEGDYYTGRCISSTGIRLHNGHCAVDPRIIPYGSVVNIPGVGKYLAVDTGSAVISREAAREAGHNPAERSALVVDLFFSSRRDGQQFAANASKYVPITWQAPNAANRMTSDVKNLVAEEDWNKLRNKQL